MADHNEVKARSAVPQAGAGGADGEPSSDDTLTETLRASEARFRSVVEGSPQGIIVQQHGRIVYANPAMARLFGYSDSREMLGLSPFEDLIADEDLSVFRTRTAAAYRGEQLKPHAGWRARHRDGKAVWLSSTAQASEWQGRAAVASFYFDITERKFAELALQESESRYRSALTAGRMGTWETDFVAGTRAWSEEGMALFGLTLDEGRGHVGGDADEFLSAMHPDDRHLLPHFHQLADEQGAFLAEYRIVRPDKTILWLSGRGQVVSRTPAGRAHRLVNIVADITERKATEDHVRLLLREISHRSKNLLAVIQAIAAQTIRTAGTMEAFNDRFVQRLRGLAASQDVLVLQDWRGAPLGDLVRSQLAPFASTRGPRLDIAGPDVAVTAEAAQAIGLALHELATNAMKYGALSGTSGKVIVSWAFEADPEGARLLRMHWIEQGGPAVAPPSRKGFGHVVLEGVVAQSVEGEVVMTFDAAGLKWSLSIPATKLKSETDLSVRRIHAGAFEAG